MFKFKCNQEIGNIEADNGLCFEYGNSPHNRPFVKIKIKVDKTNKAKDCDFLLDTGSPINLLKIKDAVRIGIDIKKDDKPRPVYGIGGKIDGYEKRTRIIIGNNPDIPIPIIIVLSETVPNILGIGEGSILSMFAMVFDKDKFGFFLRE